MEDGTSSVSCCPGRKNLPASGMKIPFAFLYGPVVLAGLCEGGTSFMYRPALAGQLLTHDGRREWGSWKSATFTPQVERRIRFVPFYEVGYEKNPTVFTRLNQTDKLTNLAPRLSKTGITARSRTRSSARLQRPYRHGECPGMACGQIHLRSCPS